MPANQEPNGSRSAETHRQIDETYLAIANVKEFLDQIAASDQQAQEHVEHLLWELEARLERLYIRDRLSIEGGANK